MTFSSLKSQAEVKNLAALKAMKDREELMLFGYTLSYKGFLKKRKKKKADEGPSQAESKGSDQEGKENRPKKLT